MLGQLASGSAWTIATWLVTISMGPLITVILVRSMTAAAFGQFAIASSVAAVLAVLTGMGLESSVTRFGAAADVRDGAEGLAEVRVAALRIARRSSAVALPVAAGVVVVAHTVKTLRPAVPALAVLMTLVLVAPYSNILGGQLRAQHRPRPLAVAAVLSSACYAVAIVLATVTGHGSAIVVAAATSLEVLLVLAIRAAATRTGPRSVTARSRSPQIRPMVVFGAAMLVGGALGVLISELDVFVLGAVRGQQAVSRYAPTSMVANAVLGIPALVGAFFLPIATRLVTMDDLDGLRDLYHAASRWNMALCLPGISLLVVCPAQLLSVIFGPSHVAGASGPLRILGLGVAAQGALGYNGLTLDAHGRAGTVAVRQFAGVVLSVVLCVALIPVLGSTGAAIATAVSLALSSAMCSWSLFRRYRVSPLDRPMAVTLAVAVAGSLLALLFGMAVSSPLGRCVLTVALAGGMTMLACVRAGPDAERRGLWRQLSGALRGLRASLKPA
jgi:O-antigen/teichoic acid export membrane protein